MEDEVLQHCIEFRQDMQRFSMIFTAGINNILGRGGVNLPQYNTLSILQVHGNVKMGELAHLLGVTMGAATNLADKLVNTGYISRQRDDHDRRVVRVTLTAKGRRQVREIDETFLTFCTQIMEQVDRDTRVRFLADLEMVLNLMQKHCGPGATSE